MEQAQVETNGGGAVTDTAASPRRIVALLLMVVALVAVPVAMSGNADAVPSVPRLKTVACTGGTYTVVRNDSWSKIASTLKVSMSALLAANNATAATWLYPGDVLCLPSGAVSTSSSAPATTVAPTTTSSTTSTSVVPKGPVTIRQFPVQGLCWFTDTWGAPRSGGRRHQGVDIIAKSGKAVYAVDDGTLTKQYVDTPGSLSGNGWRLTRADGTYFFYAHFSAFAPGLKVGSAVKAGQIIGYVGMTGNAGAPHLHFEVHPGGGAAVNPTSMVKVLDGCQTTTVPAQPNAVTSTTTTVKPAVTTTTVKPVVTTTTVKPAVTTTTVKPAVTTTTVPAAPPAATLSKWEFIAPVMALNTASIARPLVAGQPTTVKVAGLSGVSPNTTSVMLRIVAPRAATAGTLRVHACGTTPPAAAALTFGPTVLAATVASTAVTAGTFCVTSTAKVDVRMAVIAQTAATGTAQRVITPRRALDTRPGAPVKGGTTVAVAPAKLGQASNTQALSVTVTIVAPKSAGSFGLGACGGTPWVVAFPAGASLTYTAVMRTNAAGLCLSPSVDAHVVLDVRALWNPA
jgi:murein DD-endopeptidase MepM/ murein hydrolase activator NlpD